MQGNSLAAMVARRQAADRVRAAEVAHNREVATFCRVNGICMNRIQWDSPEVRAAGIRAAMVLNKDAQ